MRVCIVYDCLFPWTVGGAERWYRNLAEELGGAGHEVTYVTRRQWPVDGVPELPGVRVVAVCPGGPLYGSDGNRRVGPPLRFGWGVLRHLLARRGAYDAVHVCAFPFFSLLAARVALCRTAVAVGVDWFEVWTRTYWRDYLGPVGGLLGYAIQRLCVRTTPQAFVFSGLHARRLAEEGLRRAPVRLPGLYTGPPEVSPSELRAAEKPPLVLFAGRHIAEKRAASVPGAIAAASRRVPGLCGLILGDGPEREQVLTAIQREGLTGRVQAPGFVGVEELNRSMARASCLLLPSVREGYGLVVIEAASAGTPSVVVSAPDNAATELIEEGVNGHVAPSADPEAVGQTIALVIEEGEDLRRSTHDWFARSASSHTARASAKTVIDTYRAASAHS